MLARHHPSLTDYPVVHGEFATIRRLLEGRCSIARIGDGELKMMFGAGYTREPKNPELAAEMKSIVYAGDANCLVGLWTFDTRGPKYTSMLRHYDRFIQAVNRKREYYSSLISRPDCAPWIDNVEYAQLVESLWRDKNAAVVCEHKGSMHGTVRLRAAKAWHIRCPHREAYAQIDRLEAEVLALNPDIAILSAGPTATCLAHRLAGRGVQAIDLGSCGRWLGRLLE